MAEKALFYIGQVIHHKLLNYRGVIVDVDAYFQSSDAWYDLMALSKPPKDKPWYHILVDGADYMTYVAEQNLEPDPHYLDPVFHPEIDKYFSSQEKGVYITKRAVS